MNTTENNKLIAEFLHGKNAVHPNQYHENWNELMQVVEKIENISQPCTLSNPINAKRVDFFKGITIFNGMTPIYIACLRFVQWYNQQNQ